MTEEGLGMTRPGAAGGAQEWARGSLPMAAFIYHDGSVERSASPGTAPVLAASPKLVAYAQAFAESGARSTGFFWRDQDGEWLRVCLDEAPAGQGGAGVLMSLVPSPLPHHLTPRELDVLTLMASGLSNQEIAGRLVASSRTVSTHVEHILGKLGQSTRTGAASMAVDHGYLRLPLPGQGAPPEGLTVGFLHTRAEGMAAPSDHRGGTRRWCRRPLLIGSAFPLRGPAAGDGREMRSGSALAVAEINARGGIGGRQVEQIVVDMDIFSASGVKHAFEQLFAANVDALTSGYVFEENAARELASGYGAPYVHAMTSESHAQIVRDNHARYQNIFQVCPTELHYAAGFIRFLNEARQAGWRAHSTRIGFIETALPSGQMVNPLATELADRSGWQIASVQTVRPTGVDWPAVVDRIRLADPAAVMVTQFLASELAAFQRLASQRMPDTLIYAVYAPSVPEFLQLAGDAAEGLVWATVTGTYSDLLGQRFSDDYVRAYGRPPGRSHAGIAYDEIHLLAQAWMSVPNPTLFPEVSRQLRRARYRGVNGAYFLDNAGQSGLGFPDVTPDPSLGQAHLVFQVQDRAHRIISPPPYADSTFRIPGPARRVAPAS